MAVKKYLGSNSKDRLLELLSMKKESGKTLTIVPDETMHRIPANLIEGEKFLFSVGNIDTTDSTTVKAHMVDKLSKLFEKLRSEKWSNIRLIYSGHAILPAYIKLMVYRVTHLETEDFAYFGDAGYIRLKIDIREEISLPENLARNDL